jgi:hypothetical protein
MTDEALHDERHPEKVEITVKYTGKHDFREEVPGGDPFGEVKLQAMRHFGIEPSAASKYVLQHDGVDLPDSQHVSSLHKKHVSLVLTLKHEPPKG